MQELDDIALLHKYAGGDSEEAFATLVTRHIDRVYSVALRHTSNPHHAEEITQAVFVILAKKSKHLRKGVILEGWLYQTARMTAVTHIRSEIRRTRREREAYMRNALNENESEVWSQIAPLLDAALAGLSETDRNAVVLRFFYGKSMKEIGTALGANEDTARMRVNRAIEKLRKFLSKRGVSSTTAIVAGTLSANSVQAAPMALAKSVTAVAIAKGAAASTSTLTLIKGALKIMAWTKIKMAIVVGAGILLATGTTIVTVKEIKAHTDNALVFTAEGLVSTEFRRNPLDTNNVMKSDGKFLFSYSNNVWRIQFTYFHQDYPSQLSIPVGRMATMIDDKRIPDGIREIVTFPSMANETKPKNWSPSAIVQTNTFPSWGQQGLFLPWLSLSPNPELPLVDSNRIHFVFQPELFDNSKNEGGFKASYIEPEKQFLSELIVTNNGTLFLSDGKTMEYPEPAYTNGYVQFSYKVLETTNCQGINFPLNAVLNQYAPLPNGKSPEDLYLSGITKLSIQQIDVGGHNLTLVPAPARVVALDKRPPGLKNLTMNYDVTNDQYYALTNARMEQLANFYRRLIVNKPARK